MKVKCLIVDDEPPARQLLTSYISKLKDLELCGECDNGLKAFEFLQGNEVNLVFLDIQMPRMSGTDLVRSLRYKPGIILTTAYREFAAEGFDLDVLDYLVKPFSFERFLRAVAKYNHFVSVNQLAESSYSTDPFNSSYMFLKVNKEMVKVYLKDILYIESVRDYIKIVTEGKTYLTYQRINYMEEKLPENHFARIHKSFIAATGKISSFGSHSLKLGSMELPVGRHYKQKVNEILSLAKW